MVNSPTVTNLANHTYEKFAQHRPASEYIVCSLCRDFTRLHRFQGAFLTSDLRTDVAGIQHKHHQRSDPRYIVDLVARVIQVSLETVRIVAGLPAEYSVPILESEVSSG